MEIFSEATEEQTIKLPTVHHFIVYSELVERKRSQPIREY